MAMWKREPQLKEREGFITTRQAGFTLIELLVVIGIIGVLAAISVPVYSQYKSRAYDSESKSELHNIFLTCKAYWGDNGSTQNCTVTAISNNAYGYIQSSGVAVTLTGDENTLNSSATSSNTGNTFYLNPAGKIN